LLDWIQPVELLRPELNVLVDRVPHPHSRKVVFLWIVFQKTTLLAMTKTMEKTSADGTSALAGIAVEEVIAAARDLARGGRWHRAVSLVDATTAAGAQARALLALAAAEVALEADWFSGTSGATGRLSAAEEACAIADLDPGSRWDLAFLR